EIESSHDVRYGIQPHGRAYRFVPCPIRNLKYSPNHQMRKETAMSTKQKLAPPPSTGPDVPANPLKQYGCGPVEFTGISDALYERHLLFDNVVSPSAAGGREQFEAFAHSVRDVLSQRWVLTEDTYERENPKRVYYLSMEFLIGRSL